MPCENRFCALRYRALYFEWLGAFMTCMPPRSGNGRERLVFASALGSVLLYVCRRRRCTPADPKYVTSPVIRPGSSRWNPSDHWPMYEDGTSYSAARMNVGDPVRAKGCSKLRFGLNVSAGSLRRIVNGALRTVSNTALPMSRT